MKKYNIVFVIHAKVKLSSVDNHTTFPDIFSSIWHLTQFGPKKNDILYQGKFNSQI